MSAGSNGGMTGVIAVTGGAGAGGVPVMTTGGIAGAAQVVPARPTGTGAAGVGPPLAAVGGTGGMAGTGGMGGTTAAAGGGGSSARSTGCGRSDARTGTYDATVMSSGRSRTFTVTAAMDYDPELPHRLIIGFHGRDWDGRKMRQYLNLERYSDGKTIFVYPWAEENQGYVGWKLGPIANRFGGDDDLIFYDDMLASLRETYCIDSARVFVTGQSWGGDMTQLVSCLRGASVRAGIAVAANGTYYLPTRAGECTGQPDVFTLHGVDDRDIAFSQGEALRDFWVREHECQSTTMPVQPDQCVEFSGCQARTVWCPYGPGNGGHQIPNWYSKTAMDWFLAL